MFFYIMYDEKGYVPLWEISMKEFFKRKGIKGIIFSITFAIIYFILYISGAFNGLNNFFMDRIYQKPKATNNEIFIVAIDDKSLNELGY